MKPVIIYITKDNPNLYFSKEQFEKIVEDVYNDGYKSGYKEGYDNGEKHTCTFPINITSTPYQPVPIYYTSSPTIDPNKYEITCEAHNSIGD